MKINAGRIGDLKDFMQVGIWKVRLHELKVGMRLLIVGLRVLSITIRKYVSDNCSLRSSALTFYALMSIVPVAAVAFAIAKGFGFQQKFEQQLMEQFSGHEDVVTQVIEFSRHLLENTQGGVLAGVGVIVLLWSVIKVLDNIEQSFNYIWGVKKARSFGRKFSDYLSIMLIAPVLLIIASSATVMVVTQISHITEMLGLGFLNILIAMLVRFIPYCLIWLLFAFVYIFIPNTKVNLASGLIAGVAAGTIFEVVQKVYIYFQVGVAQYNAIYGSFAALPLFLVWLQLSWFIVLFGAELSYAHQNIQDYEFELDLCSVSPSLKNLLGVLITHQIVKNFMEGAKALNASQISASLELPFTLVKGTLSELTEAGVVMEAASDHLADPAYLPAHDTSVITVSSVIDAIEDRGINSFPMPDTKGLAKIGSVLKEFRQTLRQSNANVLLRDI